MFLDITIIILTLILIGIFLRCKKMPEPVEETPYDPWIELEVCSTMKGDCVVCKETNQEKGTYKTNILKEDIVEVTERAVPGCVVFTRQGDMYNSPYDCGRVLDLLRS